MQWQEIWLLSWLKMQHDVAGLLEQDSGTCRKPLTNASDKANVYTMKTNLKKITDLKALNISH